MSPLRSTVLALAFSATASACGRIQQRGERWIAEKPPGATMWIGLEPTRTDEDGGMFRDREIHERGPYTAYVGVRSEQVDAPLRVHAMRLYVGDAVTQLHESESPLEATVEPGRQGQPSSAHVSVPLGERLVWREHDVVSLEVDATLPGETSPTTERRKLTAVLDEWSVTKFEALMSQ